MSASFNARCTCLLVVVRIVDQLVMIVAVGRQEIELRRVALDRRGQFALSLRR